ncbi:hypothetical protein BSPWISOX_104 [uncultured Gammaproteobacteria bacterium]|jgi:hypothetical protein|nr:hypothetical protein BSPCLSOX_2805 [uncultured Gammaproteobacteria bacterium]VVH62755.1 hypothetical protein BSPWISOX_104 [uncultured Gammaproteobacteria bacterium]VVM25642.1 hypothetical protein BSPWISOXPB_7678 [uncultured Gammaproteobacteria bacterium]
MELTLLEIIGNAVQLLLLVVLPVVLAIKNWDTTLKAIKMLLKFVMTSTPKVIKFIIPILAWGLRALPEDYNSNSGSWSSDDKAVDAGKTYQNGVDGAQRVPGKTFYR